MTYEQIKNLKVKEYIISELLPEVKDYLKITWSDEDNSIMDLISEASQYLSEKVGTDINFKEDLKAKSLLKDYCRYVRNYSKEYFEQNFLNDILFLQLKYASEDLEDGKSES